MIARHIYYLAKVGILTFVYVVSARIGLSFAFLQPQATPVWPPTGIALAALLLLGYRFWPGVALGAFLANFSIGGSASVALCIASGNTLESLVGAYSLRRLVDFHNSLYRPRDVAGLVTLGAGVSTTTSATIGVTALSIAGLLPWANFTAVWLTWWIGDAVGALVVTPVLLAWGTPGTKKSSTRQRRFEAIVLLTGVILVSHVVFSTTLYIYSYLIFPFLIWSAFRFKQRGATIVTLIVSGFAIGYTVRGLGTFATADANLSLTMLILYCGVVAITGLFLAAVVDERERIAAALRKRAEEALRQSEERYRSVVNSLAEGIILYDADGVISTSNANAARILGLTTDQVMGWATFAPRWEAIHEDGSDFPGETHPAMVTLRTGVPQSNVVMGVYKPDGTLTWISINSQPVVREGQSQPYAVVASFFDITERKQAQDELAREHNLLRTLIDNMPDYIYVKDSQGRFLINNVAQVALLGATTPEDTIGKTDFDFFPHEQAAGFFADEQAIIQTNQPLLNREAFVTDQTTGSLKWIDTTKVPLRDDSGRITRIVGIGRDITERKRVEEALRQSEAAEHEQRILAEALRDTAEALVATLDPVGVMARILENVGRVVPHNWSDIALIEEDSVRIAYVQGWSPDEENKLKAHRLSLTTAILQQMLTENAPLLIPDTRVYPDWVNLTPQIRSYAVAPIWVRGLVIGFLRLSSAEPGFWVSGNFRGNRHLWGHHAANEPRIPPYWESTPEMSKEPGFFTAHHAKQLQAFASQAAIALENAQLYDALHRHAHELEQHVAQRTAELQRAKEHVEAILNNSSDAILVVEAGGTISQVNPTFSSLFGYQAVEVIGHSFAALAQHGHTERLASALSIVVTVGSSQRIEIEACRKDGTVFSADVGLSPILGQREMTSSTGVSEVVCNIHDITERKRVESDLHELNRMKTEFVSTAAHELRTPLTAIQGFSELLLTRDIEAHRVKHYLQVIHEHSTQLRRLIDTLLDISRLESKRGLTLDLQPINVANLVDNILVPFIESSPQHHFQLEGLSVCPSISGDAFRLGQVLQNLLSNAVKYSPQGGIVILRGQVIPGFVEVSVQDEGIGVTPEQQVHLFERFYRANASDTAVGGTGLGLAISKLIIELHGGHMRVDSEYGIGSTFYFTLPLSGI